MRFWIQMGGELIRLSWRKCQKVAPSWSGLRGAPLGRGLAVGDQAGEGLVPLLGAQGRAELDDAVDLGWSGVSLGVRDAGGDDDRLARSGHELRAVEGEVRFAGQDGEALFLAGVDVLGDHPAGDAAPGEADELPVAVLGQGGVGDPLAGGGVEEGPEASHGVVSLRHAHRAFGLSRAGPAGRSLARSWKPAAAVPRSTTPAAMPVVTASAEPDIVTTRMTGPAVSAQPTGR